jgi:MSHA biogenesis protein MshK
MMTVSIAMFNHAGSRFAYRGAAGCLLAALALLCAATAQGETLSDPTRPADAWLAAQAKSGSTSLEQNATPKLQLLLIGPSRKFAIINGQTVRIGDTYKDSRLVAVRPGEVVLQDDKSLHTLKIYPGIRKTVRKQ